MNNPRIDHGSTRIGSRSLPERRPVAPSLPSDVPPPGQVRFGDLRRLRPFSRVFGADRARDPLRGPVDRYYIEHWLETRVNDIRARVLEVGFDMYTRKFGGGRVSSRDVLSIHEGRSVTIIDDLTRPAAIIDRRFDCIILTQTLPFIYDVPAALRTLRTILAPGGVLLATFPGICHVCRHEMDHGGDYWRFTTAAARHLFEEHFAPAHISVDARGNVLAAVAFLMGLSSEEVTHEELDFRDPDYEVLITVRAAAL
jgi:SAM-dependent methyltransferase